MKISKFFKALGLATTVTISSSGKLKRTLAVAASTVLLATGAVVLGPVKDASAAVCQRRNETHNDNNGGVYHQTWNQVSYCPNKAGAPIYANTDTEDPQNGTMLSTNSWFVCWLHGAFHRGNNDIWYYTQGDKAVRPESKAWGYMPAVYVNTTNDPRDSKLPECPF